ncbi:MAG: HoxN/HupN/NixA family nickel/cobalt transporter [Solirubrobacterales bacterium]
MSASTSRRRHVAALATAIGLLHAVGFFVLLVLVAPRHLSLAGGGVFGIGLGLTAYALGMRHAFDADHIAAIDGTTRKLAGEGRESISVGFFFSLGHSTVVAVLGLVVALGVTGVGAAMTDDGSAVAQFTGIWGPSIAGLFLLVIGVLNLGSLASVFESFRSLRHRHHDRDQLNEYLAGRGVMNRLYGRLTRSITRPWQMYPVGFLFGLGFDTATEVGLLVLAGGAAASGLPFYAVMCLPVLFAAGMTLFDTLNTVLMRVAYAWAFERPVRRLYYNLTVTSLTAFAALIIGSLSLAGVAIEQFGLTGGAWSLIAAVELEHAGYALVLMFAAVWALAIAIWRFGKIEQRWQAPRSSL